MHRGFVKLWRQWDKHEVSSDPNAWIVFTHILIHAAHKPRTNRRYGYTLERGQSDLTIAQISQRCSISVQAVREALKRLQRYDTIQRNTQSGKIPAITTIVNYSAYNDKPEEATGTTTHTAPDEQPTNNQQTTDKQPLLKKLKNGEEAKKKKKGLVFSIPDDLSRYADAINQWIAYRAEIKKPYKSELGWKQTLGKMRKLGSRLPASLNEAMANGWAGFFEPTKQPNQQEEIYEDVIDDLPEPDWERNASR